jgi:hypothetical protein
MDWERWVPPDVNSIEQLGGQVYWVRVIRANEHPELCDPGGDELWRCTLFGPPTGFIQNIALRQFSMLAEDAARIILPRSEAKGKALLSRWLIYLADRDQPLQPGSQRRVLHWPGLGSVFCSPIWVPLTPRNPPASWWAVRLTNVFRCSRDAIGADCRQVELIPANEAARLFNVTIPLISRWHKKGKVRGRRLAPGERIGKVRLLVQKSDVERQVLQLRQRRDS